MTAPKVNISDYELKSVTEQTYNTSYSIPYTIRTEQYIKMHARTQFSINFNISGIPSYYSTIFKPNIFNVSASVKCNGILDGSAIEETKPIWYTDYYEPLKNNLKDYVKDTFNPTKLIKLEAQWNTNKSEDDDLNNNNVSYLVHDKASANTDDPVPIVKYNTLTDSISKKYRLYYPIEVESTGDEIPDMLMGLQIAANDKIWQVTTTTFIISV